jgi:hypothetical protein
MSKALNKLRVAIKHNEGVSFTADEVNELAEMLKVQIALEEMSENFLIRRLERVCEYIDKNK